jgi:hypothetical protein
VGIVAVARSEAPRKPVAGEVAQIDMTDTLSLGYSHPMAEQDNAKGAASSRCTLIARVMDNRCRLNGVLIILHGRVRLSQHPYRTAASAP